MAQHDYNIANSDGATVRADLNSALAAVVSLNSGASAPSTTFAYQWWADTTNGLLKQRNAADSAWLLRGPLAGAGVLVKTGSYSVALADFGKLIDADASGGDFTITLPAAGSAGDGFIIAIKNTGASGTVTIDGNGAETLDGATTKALAAQYDSALLRCDGGAWHVVAETAGAAVAAASQAEQETGTEAAKYVAPATQHYHPSAAKFWCKYDGSAAGPITPDASYNVTDVTDNSAGIQTVNVATDFSGTDWAVAAISDRPNTEVNAQAAGTVEVRTGVESSSSEFAKADATAVYVIGFGDQS